MSLEMNKSDACTMKFTVSETEKLIRKGRDVFRNANASLHVSKDTRQRQALLYVKEKKIHDIIEFLFGNLLLRRPNDPYEYLKELLDKYILFRSGLVDTPFAFPFHSK